MTGDRDLKVLWEERRGVLCVVCDRPFTSVAAWDDRHDTDAGPAHPDCCCPPGQQHMWGAS